MYHSSLLNLHCLLHEHGEKKEPGHVTRRTHELVTHGTGMCRSFPQCVAFLPNVSLSRFGALLHPGALMKLDALRSLLRFRLKL